MEKEPDAECGSSSSCMSNVKSKLDTLSKDDLTKFAKKQMGLMQKLKSKCTDLEEKLETLKAAQSDSSNDPVIKELTERMDAVLLEKAETQQMLILLRKENEKLKTQKEESLKTVAVLQQKLDHAEKNNAEKTMLMEEQIKTIETANKKELEYLKKLAEENEINTGRHLNDFNSQIEVIREEYESKISDLAQDLELAKNEWITKEETLKATHQIALQKAQEEIVNFQEMISRLNKQHDDEIRYLEEQLEINAAEFDIERERLLLIQEELSEQITLKESHLQDVQEEEEDFNRRVQIPENEIDKLRLALQDSQLQNAMLQEELTFLSNVKAQLEGDMNRLKEEFCVEREELEFKINELQMTKEEGEIVQKLNDSHKSEMEELEVHLITNNNHENKVNLQESHDLQNPKVLSEEKRAIGSQDEHTIEFLKNIEMEPGNRTSDPVKGCNAMKDQAKISIQALQESLSGEETVIEKLKCLDQTQDELKHCNTSVEPVCVSYEQMAKLQKGHQSSSKERDALGNDDKLFELQKQVCYILLQNYSVSANEEEDISVLLNHLLSRVEDDKLSCIALTEERTKLHKDLQIVSDERNDLKKVIETSEKQNFEMQRHVCEILEQHYSIKTSSGEDTSALLNQLVSSIQEEKMGYNMLKENNIKQQGDLMTVVQERDDLRSCVKNLERKLSDALKNVSELLEQNYSLNIAQEADIFVLLKHLQSKIQDEKLILRQQLEEKEIQLSQQKKQGELSDYGNIQKTSLNEALLDADILQGDQNEQGDITGSLLGQENKAAVESGAQETDDMKRLQQKLDEKDSIVAHLKEELSHIQETKIFTLNENMKQMELLENENKEKGERLNKFKAVAVKAKKELENSKKEACRLKEELEALRAEKDKMSESMKDVIHGAEAYKNLMIDYDKQTELLDKEKEKLESMEKLLSDLNKRLNLAVEQNKQLFSEKENLMSCIEVLQSNVRQLEIQVLEVHKVKSSMERDLEEERILKEQKTKEHVCAVKEVDELHIVIQKQKQQLQQTEQELEQLRKDAQQSTLLDMEMADYERLVKELNQQLHDKDSLLKEQERQTQAQREREEKLNQEIGSLKSLVDIEEEKTAKVKQLLVKTKKDLSNAKKEEASQMMIQSSLRGELEAIQQQLETYKIQCSELTADRHRLQEQLKSVSDQHQRSVTSYQHQVATLENDLSSTKAEFNSTKSEFESYKVRVHNVLKQQKNKSSTQGDSDFSKQDRENMETMIQQLRSKLQESQLNAKSCNAELQQLQTEYDTLLERHNKMLQQTIAKEAELRERLLSLHSENASLKSEHSQSVAQLMAQTETLRSSFCEQLHHVQDEHRSTVETLQHQINSLETQLFQLQKEPISLAVQQQSKKLHSEKKLTDLTLFEMNMAREEGEGMETTETESPVGTSPPSLEQLLTSPDPKHEPFVWQVEPTKVELTNQLNTATRSMGHINCLLRESEATNAILMEQINLLKSEMRRLERNQEREKSVANLEYLKNVLLQFIFLRAGSEKQALLPVIHTMLQLSPEEKSKLSAIAHGEEEATTSRGSGWTSYLHSWSGIR